MAYDPQSEHRRPRPRADDPIPVDALIDGDPARDGAAGARSDARTATDPDVGDPLANVTPDDPAPHVNVTPGPADPFSDRFLFRTGLGALGAAVAALLALRWLWRYRHRTTPNPS